MKQIDERRLKKLIGQLEEFIDALTEDVDVEEADSGPEDEPVARAPVSPQGSAPTLVLVPPKSLAKADQAQRDKNEL